MMAGIRSGAPYEVVVLLDECPNPRRGVLHRCLDSDPFAGHDCSARGIGHGGTRTGALLQLPAHPLFDHKR
jgi:hypothetical protein